MVNRATKLRWRRRFKRGRRQVENLGEQAEQQLEEQVIGRLGRLWQVRRFLAVWLMLVGLLGGILVFQSRALSQYYQVLAPYPGGTYTEGIFGSFTTANPLYATGPVNSSVARLVFAGLFKYNDQNQLVGDLASSWKVNDRGNVYTVTLKPHLKWQDGAPLTSADVVFTYQTIQNPDARSPLFGSWQGVKVEAVDANTVSFTLPQALSSFPYQMTNGLIPEHILKDEAASQLRTISFDTTNPVGAGPFSWKTIQVVGNNSAEREERIALIPNAYYVDGKPKLDSFVIRAFHSQDAMITSFSRKELSAVVGLNSLPGQIAKHVTSRQYSFPLNAQTMVFFKTSAPPLDDVQVRQALVRATDVVKLTDGLGYPVQAVDEPFLRNQSTYDPAYQQASFNQVEANRLLEADGWVRGHDGYRYKADKILSFNLATEDVPEYNHVASTLQQQWRAVGVKLQVTKDSPNDLQTAIAYHTYDALLYGISVGVDPDVFAYWDSSQADVRAAHRFNFSEYKSATADKALEAGRTRSDPALRDVKYRPFLQAWQQDAPAVGLYQPRFLYITSTSVAGLKEHAINEPTDRYNNVQNWMILTGLRDAAQQ